VTTSIESFDVRTTSIEGLVVLAMKQVTEDRGVVREFYRESAFLDAGLASMGPWVQLNITETRRGAIRGMHGEPMVKLVGVAAGEAFGAYVDVRPESASRGAVETLTLVPGMQVLVPQGVCNGFQAVSEPVQYVYCFDREWQPAMDGVAFTPLDPALGFEWPIEVDPSDRSQVSAKDCAAPTLAELLDGGVGGR
jgi:dTDP-4-dehydrorhamnose 3,5-epimerase